MITHHILCIIQNGDRIVRETPGMEKTASNIMGASTDFLARNEISDEQRRALGNAIGYPEDTLPDGSDISTLQRGKGPRHYRGSLGRPAGPGTGLSGHPNSVAMSSNGRGKQQQQQQQSAFSPWW